MSAVINGIKLGPTGKCFDHALDEFCRLIEERRERRWNNEYMLAHGIMKHETGYRYSHAWLETRGECWDFGIVLEGKNKGSLAKYSVEKAEYYRVKQVEKSTLYTWDAAHRWNLLMNNFGPWLPEYRELCKNVRNRKK